MQFLIAKVCFLLVVLFVSTIILDPLRAVPRGNGSGNIGSDGGNGCKLSNKRWNRHKWDFHPKDAWTTGDLVSRAQRFAGLYQFNVIYLPEVIFKAKGLGESRRGMLVISTKGLSGKKMNALTTDYLRALSAGSISFPGGSSPGHLYMRVGRWSFDWEGDVSKTRYSVSGNKRIEPFIAVSETELARMQIYLENSMANPDKVLGEFDSDGLQSPETANGTLTKNRVKGRCHNCTDWATTAKIGDNGERMTGLVGLEDTRDGIKKPTFRSSSRWPGWLQGSAPISRVPFVVVWTPNRVDKFASKYDPSVDGKVFKYGF